MYKKIKSTRTKISINTSYQGERIEEKIRRITINKEPITDGAPIIFTERKDGVLPAYDIRTDRFEVAVEAMDKVQKTYMAQREERQKLGKEAKENMEKEKKTESKTDGKPESTQGTDSNAGEAK